MFNSGVKAELINASKEYKSGDTIITALQPTDFQLKQGELTLILGPSGSGKTTLISLIGCVIYPSNGEVYINGQNVTKKKEHELADVRLKNIGFIFQNFNLLSPLTVFENVFLPFQLMKVPFHEGKVKAEEALRKVGMYDRRNDLPKNLSGGQQQRVAIARALVTKPAMMLCDEPTASQDLKSAKTVMNELKALAYEGTALAVVTHDLRLKEYADRIVYVNNGFVSYEPIE